MAICVAKLMGAEILFENRQARQQLLFRIAVEFYA
jgi:hypothetical protein